MHEYSQKMRMPFDERGVLLVLSDCSCSFIKVQLFLGFQKGGLCVFVWGFLFNLTLNMSSSVHPAYFTFPPPPPPHFFLNHMGDFEAGGTEDTHEDTVNCNMT